MFAGIMVRLVTYDSFYRAMQRCYAEADRAQYFNQWRNDGVAPSLPFH